MESISQWKYGTKMKYPMQEFSVSSAGLGYVRECLVSGRELSASLLECVNLDAGKLSTFLPQNVTSAQINEFLVGGKLPQPNEKVSTVRLWNADLKAIPLASMDEVLISIITAHLKLEDDAFCIFENALASPGDRWLEHSNVQTVMSERSVYHFLTPARMEQKLIELTVKSAKSICPPLICALSRFGEEAEFQSKGNITLVELRKIAGQTEKLVVGAYDGEGYLIWSKST